MVRLLATSAILHIYYSLERIKDAYLYFQVIIKRYLSSHWNLDEIISYLLPKRMAPGVPVPQQGGPTYSFNVGLL